MSVSIQERTHVNSTTVRVVFRKKGYPVFNLTFDSWTAACNWVEKNKEKYYENPQKFIEWKEDLSGIMQQKRLKVYEHIVRPIHKKIK